jgi:hypothetical protein
VFRLGYNAYFLPLGSGMSGFPGLRFTAMLFSGILSRPWSLLASLPPEVDVPLPLLFGAIPAVSLVEFTDGAGLASGLPGLVWAWAHVPERANVAANAIMAIFMLKSSRRNNRHQELWFRPPSAR